MVSYGHHECAYFTCLTSSTDRGRRIDQFHLVKKIGSGYASTVYLATCRSSGNQVAVKLYHKNKLSELNYFQVSREIRIHSSLDHKNIIQLVSPGACMQQGHVSDIDA